MSFRVRDCTCPGTPHPDGDTVSFAPRFPLTAGIAITQALRSAGDDPVAQEAEAGRALLLNTIVGWNFEEADAEDKVHPVPFSKDRIEELLPWEGGGFEAYQEASRLFQGVYEAPLLARLASISANGRTPRSIRRTRPKSGTPKPLASSSPKPAAETSAA